MQNLEFTFILFPPGFGGNHLKNMLGLYAGLYKTENIIPVYKKSKITAHVYDANLEKHVIISDMQKYKEKILLCGHIGQYLFIDNFLNQLKNRKFLLFNWTQDDIKLLEFRWKKIQKYFIKSYYFLEEQSAFYSLPNVAKLVNCSQDDIMLVKVNDLFQDNIIESLDSYASFANLDKGHNVESCVDLHSNWLLKNIKVF